MAQPQYTLSALPKAGFRSTAPQLMQTQLLTPDQVAARQNMLRMGQQQLANPRAGFDPIAQQARMQFQNQTIPTIAERFTMMNPSAQRSGAFLQNLGAAGSELDANLAAQQAEYGQRAQQLAQQLMQMGMSPEFAQNVIPGQEGWGRQMGGALLSALPAVAAAFTPVGGIGALAAGAGAGLKSLFSGSSQGQGQGSSASMMAQSPMMAQAPQVQQMNPSMFAPLQQLSAQNIANPNTWNDLITQGILNPQRVPVRNRLSDWAQPLM